MNPVFIFLVLVGAVVLWNGDVPKVQGGNAATIVDAGDLTSGTATVKGE